MSVKHLYLSAVIVAIGCASGPQPPSTQQYGDYLR